MTRDETKTGPVYESPQIEQVITPDELERQVHYAGEISLER